MSGKWQFFIDRGGTFTDIVARAPDGRLLTHKLLSEDPEAYEDAAIAGIADLMRVPRRGPLPVGSIASVKMGTTVATNALLERKGDAVLLVVSEGFRDALEIGYQARAKIFARRIEKPSMLYAKVVEVPERVRADGTVETPLDAGALIAALREARANGIASVAIAFMHSYAHPAHEVAAAEAARLAGFTQISASHEVSPLVKFVGKGDCSDLIINPYSFKYLFLAKAQDRVGQIIPAIFQHAVVRSPLDEVTYLNCVVDDVFPVEIGEEIDVDVRDDSERKHQQNDQQYEELYTDRIGKANDSIKYPCRFHGYFLSPPAGLCNRILGYRTPPAVRAAVFSRKCHHQLIYFCGVLNYF